VSVRIFKTAWARQVMRLHWALIADRPATRWALVRYIAECPQGHGTHTSRWRAKFINRLATSRGERWRLAAHLALHGLLVERPLLFPLAAIGTAFLVGALVGGVMQ